MSLSRREQILKLIVEHFIKTASPVGSQTLIEQYGLTCSSATIRNEMNALEGEGYLEKTHTSSGRVPSSKGYRYYIEHLRDANVDENLKHQLTVLFQEHRKSIEEVIQESCQILSHMTNLASVVLGPNADKEQLVSIQLIPLSTNTATAIFVTDQGYCEHKTFILDSTSQLQDIEKCVSLLNERLKGTPVGELIEKMESMRPVLANYVEEHDVVYQVFMEAFVRFAKDRVNLYGKSSLINQPEFSEDTEKLKKLIRLLDSPERFRRVRDEIGDEDLSVSIGELGDGYDDVSVITSRVRIPGQSDSTIAVLGPRRMDYNQVMSALEYVAKQLDRYFVEERSENGKEKK